MGRKKWLNDTLSVWFLHWVCAARLCFVSGCLKHGFASKMRVFVFQAAFIAY